MKLYIRLYASDPKCWDDGIGFCVAAEKPETIDQHMRYTRWNEHPYQQFYIDTNICIPYFGGDILVVSETKNDNLNRFDLWQSRNSRNCLKEKERQLNK